MIHTDLDRARAELSRLERRAIELGVSSRVVAAIRADLDPGTFSPLTVMFAIYDSSVSFATITRKNAASVPPRSGCVRFTAMR